MSLFGGVTVPNIPDPVNVQRLDLLAIPPIRKMQRYGFAIDKDYFADLSSEFALEMDEKRKLISSYVPPDKLDLFCAQSASIGDEDDDDYAINPNSGPQLATLLFDVLGIGAGRRLKTTKTGKIKTDKKQLEILKEDHPVIAEIRQYREIQKLKSTYSDAIPKLAKYHPAGANCPVCGLTHQSPTHRIHTQILMTRTATSRLASKKVNQQNIPARSKRGKRIRGGFIASPGTVLVQRDFSQIELRELANLSADEKFIQAYWDGRDLHRETAMDVFGLPAVQITSMMRTMAKTASFGIVYSISGAGLFDQFQFMYSEENIPLPSYVTPDWCDEFIAKWLARFDGVKRFMDGETEKAYRYGIVWTRFGFVRRIPSVRSVHSRVQAAGLREAGNVAVQGSCAGMMKIVMAAVDARLEEIRSLGYWAWPLLTVHDELLVECDPDCADAVECILAEEMDNVLVDRQTGENYSLVPIKSEGATFDRWRK